MELTLVILSIAVTYLLFRSDNDKHARKEIKRVEETTERSFEISENNDRDIIRAIEELSTKLGYKLVREKSTTIPTHWEKIKKNKRK